MKNYRMRGKHVLEVYDLSFLRERNHEYGWLKRHIRHFCLKRRICRADRIYVPDSSLATDLVRYYFVPKEKIALDRTISATGKT